jgi:hypothetical protein
MYTNSYAQSFETNSIESINNLENSEAMNNAIFDIFKNDRAGGKNRKISRVSQAKSAHYDFSNVIIGSATRDNIGIIDDNYQRLTMVLYQIRVDPKDPSRYQVSGRSQVNQNKTDFNGTFKLKELYLYDQFDYGVDEEYQDKGLIEQGFAVFDYQLNEDSTQQYSGVFTGKLYSKWYLTDDDVIHYDFIDYYSDSYFNNLYYGTWREYGNTQSKVATWADYKLPQEVVPDLNIGAGTFSPNPKYLKYGWAQYQPKSKYDDVTENMDFFLTKICTEQNQQYDHCTRGYILKIEESGDRTVKESVFMDEYDGYGWSHTTISKLDENIYLFRLGCGSYCGGHTLVGRDEREQDFGYWFVYDIVNKCAIEYDNDKSLWVARPFFSNGAYELEQTYGDEKHATIPQYDIKFVDNSTFVAKNNFDDTIEYINNPCNR